MATIMEVTLQTRWLSQICLNVFNFLWDGVGASPGNLSTGLMAQLGWTSWSVEETTYTEDTFANHFQRLVSQNLVFELVTVKDVYSTTDFYEWTFPIPGTASQGAYIGTAEAPFIAFGYKSSKVRTDIKRGAKRFPGVSASQQTAGGTWAAGTLTLMANLATAMSLVLNGPAGSNFLSSVVKKEKVPVLVDEEPTGRFKYEYYTDPAVQIANQMSPVVWDNVTTQRSQVSRQFGRGR